MGNTIIIKDLCFHRLGLDENERVFENVELSFENASGIVLLFGASGTGKSTLLYLLAGLLKPAHGYIKVNDYEISGPMPPHLYTRYHAEECTILFQNYPLVEWLTVCENACLFANEKQKAGEYLKRLGLESYESRSINKLSFGQRQRVAIIQTLLTKNKILLMDEPTSAIDSDTKSDVMGLIKNSAEEMERLILIATHDPELTQFADWVVQVNKKKLKMAKIG